MKTERRRISPLENACRALCEQQMSVEHRRSGAISEQESQRLIASAIDYGAHDWIPEVVAVLGSLRNIDDRLASAGGVSLQATQNNPDEAARARACFLAMLDHILMGDKAA